MSNIKDMKDVLQELVAEIRDNVIICVKENHYEFLEDEILYGIYKAYRFGKEVGWVDFVEEKQRQLAELKEEELGFKCIPEDK